MKKTHWLFLPQLRKKVTKHVHDMKTNYNNSCVHSCNIYSFDKFFSIHFIQKKWFYMQLNYQIPQKKIYLEL